MTRGVYIRTKEIREKMRLSHIGKPNPNKGKTGVFYHTEETKKRISQTTKGVKKSLATRLKISKARMGIIFSRATRQKMSEPRKGILWDAYLTKEQVIERNKKISETLKNIDMYWMKGKNNHNWKGGLTPLNNRIRHSLKFNKWRKDIFKRDDYTCQMCFERSGIIHAHHKKRFAYIVAEFLAKHKQLCLIKDKEKLVMLSVRYKPFWDISNGKTLCKKCHENTRAYENTY